MRIPKTLADEWRREPGWLAQLPGLAAECAAMWDLELEEPIDTPHSLVVPAGDAVLKLNAPSHFEADHEAEALARWNGAGAVRLLADEAEGWAEEVPRRWKDGGRPFERSLLAFAVDVYRSADRKATFLANQDLHGGNILRAERKPWLVIDPKPLVGERELDGVGLLRNAASPVMSSTTSVRRSLDSLAELGLDRDRLRGWGVAHALAWGWDDEGRWSPRSVAVARAIFAA